MNINNCYKFVNKQKTAQNLIKDQFLKKYNVKNLLVPVTKFLSTFEGKST